jgi:hypothetical protein
VHLGHGGNDLVSLAVGEGHLDPERLQHFDEDVPRHQWQRLFAQVPAAPPHVSVHYASDGAVRRLLHSLEPGLSSQQTVTEVASSSSPLQEIAFVYMWYQYGLV